jgi:DNA-binding NarL/FixJ family response regulator
VEQEKAIRRPSVVIAEDFVLLQEEIRRVLEPEFDVVAAVEDGRAALETIAAQVPDVLLVDVSLPGLGGFMLAEKVRKSNPDVKIIFVTAHADPQYIARAFELGARGWVLKGSISAELRTAIRTALEGGLYRSRLLG